MVVAVIVLVWVVVLGVFAVRRISDRNVTSSVARYRYQNRTLGRVPYLANSVPLSSTPESYLNEARRRALTRPTTPESIAEASIAKARAHDRRARKRRVLGVLGATCVLTLAFGAIPVLHVLWDVAIASFVLTAAYVGLLVYYARAESLSAERKRKIVPLHLAPPISSDSDDEEQMAFGGLALRPAVRALPPVRASFVVVESPS